ncbi:MAG: type IV toxin-antitoxin system AbiEi family antitoxin domain-containing protein [Rhodospirillaceae bacterium]|nr:type IV toxin-antitoxin system AbiEi family antitoxin domain-containing protein [Rhodospirillaceae bacterium]
MHGGPKRPPPRRGPLSWEQVVLSLQMALREPLVVGGRTALNMLGYAHCLAPKATEIHLYGPEHPPSWLNTLPLEERFICHNSRSLFADTLPQPELPALDTNGEVRPAHEGGLHAPGLRNLPWGQWNWPPTVSGPERATLELLDELPRHESFHQVDMLMEGLGDLSPKRLQALLGHCRSVKVKRLFFADRHHHAWLKRLDRSSIDLGKGKRMLVKDGRFVPAYQITVPKDLGSRP